MDNFIHFSRQLIIEHVVPLNLKCKEHFHKHTLKKKIMNNFFIKTRLDITKMMNIPDFCNLNIYNSRQLDCDRGNDRIVVT